MLPDKYDNAIHEFETYYPLIAVNVSEYYPAGNDEIIAVFNDGTKMSYDCVTKTAAVVKDNPKSMLDQQEWNDIFSYNLYRQMQIRGLSQIDLSEKSEISQRTISFYMNGQSTPSAYNLCKLASALSCSILELIPSAILS